MLYNAREFVGTVLLGYAVLPTILAHFLHIGVHWQGDRDSGKVALTFDDGPDPVYTPQILDTLEKYNVKATFFLVGRHAEQYPDLVRRIVAEGHGVGVHGYHHRLAVLLDPVSSIQEIRRGGEAIRTIIGDTPLLFRPPWGVFNLCSLMYLWSGRKTTVLWSFFAMDWEVRATPKSIFLTVMRQMEAGSVVVFHDRCTKPWAADDGPAKTIQALPAILAGIRARGLKPVLIEDLMEFREEGETALGYKEI